jgi:hypothetical protein
MLSAAYISPTNSPQLEALLDLIAGGDNADDRETHNGDATFTRSEGRYAECAE